MICRNDTSCTSTSGSPDFGALFTPSMQPSPTGVGSGGALVRKADRRKRRGRERRSGRALSPLYTQAIVGAVVLPGTACVESRAFPFCAALRRAFCFMFSLFLFSEAVASTLFVVGWRRKGRAALYTSMADPLPLLLPWSTAPVRPRSRSSSRARSLAHHCAWGS